MHYVKLIFNAINYVGYCFWSFSILNFVEQILNDNFNFRNINSFLSAMAAVVALIFAIFKLIAYVRDSKTKSKILEQELIKMEHNNFPYSWDKEFIKPFKKEEEEYDNNSTSN
jgi:hypothetical protein